MKLYSSGGEASGDKTANYIHKFDFFSELSQANINRGIPNLVEVIERALPKITRLDWLSE